MTPTPEPTAVTVTPSPRRTLKSHVRSGIDKVPTKWFGLAVLVVFLGISAAFGGLADAPVQALPRLAPGDSITGAQLRLAVERAVVVDELPDQFITAAAGNRLLVIVATVENVVTEPVLTTPHFGAADNLRPVGVQGVKRDTDPVAVIVVSDGTLAIRLQPGVPERLAYVWEVPRDAVARDDTIRVDIFDKSISEGFITYGNTFDGPFVCGFSVVSVQDLGSGAEL